jgi:hypothetical protein
MMTSSRPLLVDFVPSTATLPDFAASMLAFFEGEAGAADFWTAQEAYFPDHWAMTSFYSLMYYTFTDYINLRDLFNAMGMYGVSESVAANMPYVYWLFNQIFDSTSQAEDFISKINYYGQDGEDILRMPDYYYNNSTRAVVGFVEDIGALGERYEESDVSAFVSTSQQLLAFQAPV